ncbi:hypothetical protein LINPERHAP2_LOCUS2652 [Linum perenne]
MAEFRVIFFTARSSSPEEELGRTALYTDPNPPIPITSSSSSTECLDRREGSMETGLVVVAEDGRVGELIEEEGEHRWSVWKSSTSAELGGGEVSPRYSPIKIDEGNKSSEVPDGGNFILELPIQEEEVIQECKEKDESSVDISRTNSSILFFSIVDINSYATNGFQLKDENIEEETTNLKSLIMEDSIVNLSCVFIFLLVNWIDPDGSHLKLFDNG